MSFDWREYIDLALDLLNRPEESCYRSSISRAYYGAFCLARNRKGYKKYAGADVHRKVINSYKNSIHKDERNIGRILDKLRKARNDAYYDEDKIIDQALAQRIVASANLILNRRGIP